MKYKEVKIVKEITLMVLIILHLTLIGCNQGVFSPEQVADKFLRLYLEVPDYTQFPNSSQDTYMGLIEDRKELFQELTTDGKLKSMSRNGEFVRTIHSAQTSKVNIELKQVEFTLNRTEDNGNIVYLDYTAELEIIKPETSDSKIVLMESVFPTRLVKQNDNHWLVDWHHIKTPRIYPF